MQLKKKSKNAIALMITLFFIIALSASIAFGLKYTKRAKESISEQKFTYQTRVFISDFLVMLKKLPEISKINSTESLRVFLQKASLIPLHNDDMSVIIKIKSARDRFNIALLNTKDRIESFKSFLLSNSVDPEYFDLLEDITGGIKEDGSYHSDIFTKNPSLFRDYLASENQLDVLSDYYKNRFYDNSLKNITPAKLFYTSVVGSNSVYKMDLNYIKPLCWEILIGCDKIRAENLTAQAGYYTTVDDLGLSDQERVLLSRFEDSISFFEPHLQINIVIMLRDKRAIVNFEYNLESKKGSNFVFKV